MSGFILLLKEFMHVYCFSTGRVSLRSMCINCFLIWDKSNSLWGSTLCQSLVPGQLLSTFAISTPLLKYRSRTQCMFQIVCQGHQSASADDKAGNICCQQATQCKYTVRHCKIILTTYNYLLY